MSDYSTMKVRCVICNRTSHEEIETNAFETAGHRFHRGPYGTSGVDAYFCNECEYHYRDVMGDFDSDDSSDAGELISTYETGEYVDFELDFDEE